MAVHDEVPSPRRGLAGALDRIAGPGATRPELALQLVLPAIAAALAPLHAASVAEGWSTPRFVVCALLAFDVVGGIITNSTSSGKRWYHRAGRRFVHHFGFVSLHLLHLALVSWLYLELDLVWLAITGAYLLGAAAVVVCAPLYLQRPIALAAYTVALLLSGALRAPVGLEWFLSLFYLKLLVSHLPKEQPYAPA